LTSVRLQEDSALTSATGLTGPACKPGVHVDSITRVQVLHILAYSLDGARDVKTERNRRHCQRSRVWQFTMDEVVSVGDNRACRNFDQDIFWSECRAWYCCNLQRAIDADYAGDLDVGHV
jgi:hypothetical protein